MARACKGLGLIRAIYQGERGLDDPGECLLEPSIKQSVAFAGGGEGCRTRLQGAGFSGPPYEGVQRPSAPPSCGRGNTLL